MQARFQKFAIGSHRGETYVVDCGEEGPATATVRKYVTDVVLEFLGTIEPTDVYGIAEVDDADTGGRTIVVYYWRK